MASVPSMSSTEPVEAVIISGPRKGDIIRLENGDVVLTPEEERAFDELQAAFERCVQAAKDVVAQIRGFREELHTIVKDLRRGTV